MNLGDTTLQFVHGARQRHVHGRRWRTVCAWVRSGVTRVRALFDVLPRAALGCGGRQGGARLLEIAQTLWA